MQVIASPAAVFIGSSVIYPMMTQKTRKQEKFNEIQAALMEAHTSGERMEFHVERNPLEYAS
jgi:hypothetical protein